MNLIICVSGSGGGSTGPSGLYNSLRLAVSSSFDVILFDTVPSDIFLNVASLIEIIKSKNGCYDRTFLIGWSMGGAVVVQTAYIANMFVRPHAISGLVLLASQSANAGIIKYLNLAHGILFLHGTNDSAITFSSSLSLYNRCYCKKQLVFLHNDTHNFDVNFATTLQSLVQYFHSL